MPITLTDALRIKAGEAAVTSVCRFCGLSLTNGKDICDECSTASERISVSFDRWDGLDVIGKIPDGGCFEYVRADLVEKMK